MPDETRPVTRVRRPTLSVPTPPTPDPRDAEHHAAEAAEAARDAELAAAVGEELADAEAAVATAEVVADASRAEAPPLPAARAEVRRDTSTEPLTPGFVPRAGDVLVVSYPEVTLPLPKQYAMMRFGGWIYTHQLEAGDDVDTRARAIAAWLTQRAEAEGSVKYRRLVAEFLRKGNQG